MKYIKLKSDEKNSKQGVCFAIEGTAYLFNRHVTKVVLRKYVVHVALYLLHSWKKRDR